MKQCVKCNCKFESSIIIEGKRKNLQNRKACLKCSPFKTGRVSLKPDISSDKYKKFCTKCQELKGSSEFYRRRGGTETSPYCKVCTKEQTVTRQREKKLQAVEYMGGKCVDCNYSGHPAVFDFHHINSDKEFTISSRALASFNAIKKELDKCELLCSNCHRIRHTKY